MKTILRVAKTELRTLFYSPIAWFLLIVFLIQCGIVYFTQLRGIAAQQEMGGMSLRYLNAITSRIFLSPPGLFGSIMQNLYLYIPLLTMSLISRETSSGTIKLLYSSPVKMYEIVLGKFVAMMAYSLLLVGIISIFLVSGTIHIQHADVGILMTSLLGFYLLLCAYASIGLFMSCLTTYQVVAAICTFVMIGILSYIGTLWQSIAFVRELTYFLAINGRTQKMLIGLLTTKDVIYFLVIIGMFLGFSIYKLKAGMESKPWTVKAARYVVIVAVTLLIGYVSSIPGLIGYYDATANKERTITPQTQKILADFGDEPLEITAYANLLDNFWFLGGPESYNQNLARWESYMRFKTNIRLKTVWYYDSIPNERLYKSYEGKTLEQIAAQYAKNQKMNLKDILKPAEIRRQIDLRPENNRFVMQLKWKGRTTFLRVFDDQYIWPFEAEVAAAFKRLQQAQLPKIGFITGDLERDVNKMGDRDYKILTNLGSFRYSLLNQGFDVEAVSLETGDVPAGLAALVVADPKIALTPNTVARLHQYINNGGNLLIAAEPGDKAILEPLLQPLGVELTDGVLVQESNEDVPDFARLYITQLASTFVKPLEKSWKDSTTVTMPGATVLSYSANSAFTIRPLLMSNAKTSWHRVQPYDKEMMMKAVMDSTNQKGQGILFFSAADGDVKGSMPTALSLSRKVNGKEQRIIVTGDADFMSNKELPRWGTANFVFSTGLFSWLSYGQFPIDASRPEGLDKRVNVTADQVDYLKIIYVWVMPGVLLAFAAILLLRRKRK